MKNLFVLFGLTALLLISCKKEEIYNNEIHPPEWIRGDWVDTTDRWSSYPIDRDGYRLTDSKIISIQISQNGEVIIDYYETFNTSFLLKETITDNIYRVQQNYIVMGLEYTQIHDFRKLSDTTVQYESGGYSTRKTLFKY